MNLQQKLQLTETNLNLAEDKLEELKNLNDDLSIKIERLQKQKSEVVAKIERIDKQTSNYLTGIERLQAGLEKQKSRVANAQETTNQE